MRRTKTTLIFSAGLLLVFGFAAHAFAQLPGFEYQVENKVEKGEGKPTLELRATGAIEGGTVQIERSDGKTYTEKLDAMGRGDVKKIEFDQPTGTYTYEVQVEANGGGERDVEMSFDFDAVVAEAFKVGVNTDQVRVEEGKVPLQTNRPLDRVEMVIKDSDGKTLLERTQDVGGKKGVVLVEWPPKDEVSSIELKAYDVDGFWNGVLLEPFWVEIPNEEVNFHNGKATWDDSEEEKLEKTFERIREEMRKHGDKGLELQLYIAGYTDTVGSKSDNMKLSNDRARALARWFRKNGLDIPVYYQGFGESVLAVETPDETEEPKNRRAVYVLGNAQPPTSEVFPKSAWKKVQ